MNLPHLEPLNEPQRYFQFPKLTQEELEAALQNALSRVRLNLESFPPGLYPDSSSKGQNYEAVGNVEWTAGFWTGQLWLAWELSGDETFLSAGQARLEDFRRRLDTRTATDHHDMGFLYTLSAVAEWKLTGNPKARTTALKAADLLLIRYGEKAGIIQAWGDLNDPAQKGRIIIDCALNMPLLFWASEQTGNPYYREAAISHLSQANRTLIRPDGSSFHTYFFDMGTGLPQRGATHQGFADDSCWSRGQAWGILGIPLNFRYHGDLSYLENARVLAHYFLNRLPQDLVCYWDLVFTEGDEERDSSAAAIAACGLLELAAQLPVTDRYRRTYEEAAQSIMASLVRSYTVDNSHSNGLLRHGVYHKPAGRGVDECMIWGDYYFLEALTRLKMPWKPFW